MLNFSVVVPVYNRKDLVRRALDSVLAQTHPAREIIVVDDGSNDGTGELLQSDYPSVTVIHQIRSGVSSARNKGIATANCDWVAFLDSDDEWLPKKLEKQAQWLTQNSQYQICHCNEIWIRRQTRVNPKKIHEKSGGWIFSKCLPLCVISPSAVAINTGVFSDIGVFDENLPVCEDYDLWLRITQKYPVGFLDEPLVVKHGGHDDQLSKAYPAMDRFRIIALLKLLDSNSLQSDDRRETVQVLVEKLNIYINGAHKRGHVKEVSTYQPILDRLHGELVRS